MNNMKSFLHILTVMFSISICSFTLVPCQFDALYRQHPSQFQYSKMVRHSDSNINDESIQVKQTVHKTTLNDGSVQKKLSFDYITAKQIEQKHNNSNDQRVLQTLSRQSIRITLDTSTFSTIVNGLNGAPRTTTTNLNFIARAMLVAKTFFTIRLKILRTLRVFPPQLCHDYNTVQNDWRYGVSDSDLHIYGLYVTNKNINYRATGVSCHYYNAMESLPNLDFTRGRPDVGIMRWNTYFTVDGQALTNRLFAGTTATAIHQMVHILGFDASLYSTYLDSTGNLHTSVVVNATSSIHSSRTSVTGDTYMIVTPNVVDWAQKFFDCPGISGMLLENQDAAEIGSHWQRLAVYDELMTATELGPQKGISGLTFSLLRDMGWYQVESAWNDTNNYGYHQNCDFYFDGCYGAFTTDPSFDKHFCNQALNQDVSLCATNFLGKAICTSAATLSDGCPIYASYSSCVDGDISNDGYTHYTLEKFSTSSLCIYGTLTSIPLSARLKSRCYQYQCDYTTSKILIRVSTYTIQCTLAQAGDNKTISRIYGSLTCPIFQDFCINSRKICPNWCSKNGICTRGICNCLPGFSGTDCSKTACTANQFFDPITGACLTICTTGYYQNIFSHTCMQCDSICPQCRDEPKICLNCLSTVANPKYYYAPNSSCLSTCPDTTYRENDQCKSCELTVNCGNCAFIDTNCTSCINGKYLDNPYFGSCVDTCVAPNVLYDIVNFKCVPNCIDNLVEIAGTCDKCANGYYKLINDSTCNFICPIRFYSNPTEQLCQACATSCLNCNGVFAQNCTECSPSATQKYLLLKMCVATCPRGYYANNTDSKCYECTDGLYCSSCVFNTINPTCTTCLYNYFFISATNSCQQNCPQYFYKNPWNHSCDPCHGDCGDCSSSDQASCTNCRGSRFFLANFTGGYCLSACPTNQYVTSGFNCLQCHHTCQKCKDVGVQGCTYCKQGLYRYSGICRYVCPSGTYHNSTDRSCPNCHKDCTFCFGPAADNCTTCVKERFLYNSTCVRQCPFEHRENQWNVCFQQFLKINLLTIIAIWTFLE